MLDRLGLRTALDAWTSSDEAGSCKPDAAIFRLALTKAGVDPNRRCSWATTSTTTWLGPRPSGCIRPGCIPRPDT